MARRLGITMVLMTLAVAGCVSSSKNNETGVNRAISKTAKGIDDAALTPLNDLNLRRTEIPKRLETIVSPYEPLKARTCEAILAEVTELTTILGPDADAPPAPPETLSQQAGDGAANLALGGVASAATDFIPFRSIVRAATGASAHERRLRAAYERGIQRRSFVKGVGAGLGCRPPAAPEPSAGILPPAPPIEYRSPG
jgi:hypothetical protein